MNKLLFTLTQFPIFASYWLLWESAKARPILSIVLGLLYEILMFAFSFGRKVWTKLEDRAVQHTANWIWVTASQFAPGFRRRYKKQVLSDYGIFNVRGLGLINTFTLHLEQIFVDLRIVPSSNPQKLNIDLLAQKEIIAATQPIWHYLRSADSKSRTALDIVSSSSYGNAALVIVGPPGSGKTTLLQHIALTFASNRQGSFKLPGSTPILLFLRDHVEKLSGSKPPSLGNLLYDYFSESSRFPNLKPPINWFEKELRRGKCITLLDGLDEVAGPRQRELVSNWVDDQVKNYPSSRFVLTARPQGYRDAPLLRAHILEVQPFTREQVEKFIKNWYVANETMASGGRLDRNVRLRSSKEAQDLMQRLRMSPSLSALTVNPLLLTMIAMVHRYHGALPETRIELYAEICEVLLGRWRQTKGVQEPLTAAHKLSVLRPLAAKMMELKLRDILTKEAYIIISAPLRRLGIVGKASESFLSDLQATSGLILERETDHWSFAHLTFQEYLTAAHWHKQNLNCKWPEMVGDSWWHETLRLYAAQGDATELVRACLAADTLPSLTLAAECLDEKCEIDLTVRRAVETRVLADLESSDPARRRFAAEVQLTRRLKSFQHINDQLEIDLDYVTFAEYQLFIDDMNRHDSRHVRDHSGQPVLLSGQALKPVIGVRAVDAVSFCRWLTQRYGGNWWFRLPSPTEAREYPAKRNGVAAWCSEGSSFVLVGLTTTDRDAIKQQLGAVSNLPLPESVDTLDLTRVLNEALDSLRTLHHDGKGNLTQVLIPFLRLAHELANESDLDTLNDTARFRELARGFILKLALEFDADLSQARINTFNPLIAALDQGNLVKAQLLAESGVNHPINSVVQPARLLNELLTIATQAKASKALHSLICRMIEYIYAEEPKAIKPFLGSYWCFQTLIAREKGDLNSWEGIRIVRDQIVS